MCFLKFNSAFTNFFFSVFVLQLFVCVEIASLSRHSVHFTAFVLRFFCVECDPGLISSSFVERVAALHTVAIISPNVLFTITNDKSYYQLKCIVNDTFWSSVVYNDDYTVINNTFFFCKYNAHNNIILLCQHIFILCKIYF